MTKTAEAKTSVCKHCRLPIRIAPDGVWVHDCLDEDPNDASYGWVRCATESGLIFHAEPDASNSSAWHGRMVTLIREKTGCSHEVALEVLGACIDIHLDEWVRRWSAGYEKGYDEGCKKTLRKLKDAAKTV